MLANRLKKKVGINIKNSNIKISMESVVMGNYHATFGNEVFDVSQAF
jgi:hypothetical protein